MPPPNLSLNITQPTWFYLEKDLYRGNDIKDSEMRSSRCIQMGPQSTTEKGKGDPHREKIRVWEGGGRVWGMFTQQGDAGDWWDWLEFGEVKVSLPLQPPARPLDSDFCPLERGRNVSVPLSCWVCGICHCCSRTLLLTDNKHGLHLTQK